MQEYWKSPPKANFGLCHRGFQKKKNSACGWPTYPTPGLAFQCWNPLEKDLKFLGWNHGLSGDCTFYHVLQVEHVVLSWYTLSNITHPCCINHNFSTLSLPCLHIWWLQRKQSLAPWKMRHFPQWHPCCSHKLPWHYRLTNHMDLSMTHWQGELQRSRPLHWVPS